MKKLLFPILVTVLLHVSCSTAKQSTTTLNYKGYRIEKQSKVDADVLNMLKPYSDSINKTMNLVIGFSTRGLTKRQPESELGNFFADCIKTMAEKKFGRKVDAAFVNYGGIRSYIPKGDITIGKIYELMPFDNIVLLQELKGSVFKLFLNRVAEKNGWPASGINMQIKDRKPVNIFIDGKPIDDNAIYVVANSDYIANGGDDCDMLRNIPQLNKGYLMRDALIEFIRELTAQGKSIDWKTDGRLTY